MAKLSDLYREALRETLSRQEAKAHIDSLEQRLQEVLKVPAVTGEQLARTQTTVDDLRAHQDNTRNMIQHSERTSRDLHTLIQGVRGDYDRLKEQIRYTAAALADDGDLALQIQAAQAERTEAEAKGDDLRLRLVDGELVRLKAERAGCQESINSLTARLAEYIEPVSPVKGKKP